MKTCLAIALFSVWIAVAYGGKCIDQIECDAGTCCAGIPPFGGMCLPMTPEGGKCHVVDKVVPLFGDFYIGTCPCAEGLVCVQQGKKKNKGICQLQTTTAAPVTDDGSAEDDTTSDADADEA